MLTFHIDCLVDIMDSFDVDVSLYDFIVVGAGFAGATCANILANAGKKVLVIDKRDHIGGNSYDYLNQEGIIVHKYGPHIFHTN